MTSEILIRHINESIEKALRHQSWIDVEILDLTGFSTGTMRRLYSNISHLPTAEPKYLEVGLWAGSSFCSCLNNNPTLTAVGIEDFSQPFHRTDIREQLAANVEKYTPHARSVRLLDQDCFKVDVASLPKGFHAYFFDGEHSFESQAKALPYFIDAMDDVFVFLVDDAHWSTVREGSAAGFEALEDRVRIDRQWNLDGEKPQDDPIFWNGLAIYACSKI